MANVYVLTSNMVLMNNLTKACFVISKGNKRSISPQNYSNVSQVRTINEIPHFQKCLVVIDETYLRIDVENYKLPNKWEIVIVSDMRRGALEKVQFFRLQDIVLNGRAIYQNYVLKEKLKEVGFI